jgi:hypothetical protein
VKANSDSKRHRELIFRFDRRFGRNSKSKTCPFDKLRAGSEPRRRIENPKTIEHPRVRGTLNF